VDNDRADRRPLATMEVMSFDDLPDDWADRPLDDPKLVADVLDLVVLDRDRLARSLAVLLCDERHRLLQPCLISDPDYLASEDERFHALRNIIVAFELFADGKGSLLVALARRDGLSIRADDHVWARAAQRACTGDVELLGVHVVTMDGSREVPRERRVA
jgi:hypothetical protein